MVIADTKRLIRKEVSLGTIREISQPTQYIGISQIAPFMEVPTDDVLFQYLKDSLQETMAPARAQDAESRLRQNDNFLYGTGRASLIDWAHKNRYTATDVVTYRDNLLAAQAVGALQLNSGALGNAPERAAAEFAAKVARDDLSRRRGLDLRMEWLIMQAVDLNSITYNDTKVAFQVTFGRPSDQHKQPVGVYWDAGVDHDPIGDLRDFLQVFEDRYLFRPKRALISKKALNTMWKSKFFTALLPGFPIVGGAPNVPLDINYLAPQWDEQAAVSIVERAIGVTFQVYDGFYTTRPVGSTTMTKNRFTSEKDIIFLPEEGQLGDIDNTEIGFAKTLTSPHPEGNWQSGFYEWEDEESDPWMHVRGSGIKAFPVFPYMQYTGSLRVLA